MSDPCPICGKPGGCKTYPLMLERWVAGRDREHWRRIHDQINGTTDLRAIPPILNLDPWLLKIRACENYQPGCCHSPAPFCTRYQVNPTREQCIECLGGTIES